MTGFGASGPAEVLYEHFGITPAAIVAEARSLLAIRTVDEPRRARDEHSPMSHRIVFLDRATIAPQIRVRPPSFAHELIEHAETRADQVVERLAGASIAIINKVPIRAAALERLPALKLVAVAATGTDCVDKAACAARGDCGEQHPRLRDQHGARAHVRADPRAAPQRRWPIASRCWRARGRSRGSSASSTIRSTTCAASRLGIIGEGVLGQRVAELGRAFGMLPMFAAHKGRSGTGTAVHAVARRCSRRATSSRCTAPLTAETRDMIADAGVRRR